MNIQEYYEIMQTLMRWHTEHYDTPEPLAPIIDFKSYPELDVDEVISKLQSEFGLDADTSKRMIEAAKEMCKELDKQFDVFSEEMAEQNVSAPLLLTYDDVRKGDTYLPNSPLQCELNLNREMLKACYLRCDFAKNTKRSFQSRGVAEVQAYIKKDDIEKEPHLFIVCGGAGCDVPVSEQEQETIKAAFYAFLDNHKPCFRFEAEEFAKGNFILSEYEYYAHELFDRACLDADFDAGFSSFSEVEGAGGWMNVALLKDEDGQTQLIVEITGDKQFRREFGSPEVALLLYPQEKRMLDEVYKQAEKLISKRNRDRYWEK